MTSNGEAARFGRVAPAAGLAEGGEDPAPGSARPCAAEAAPQRWGTLIEKLDDIPKEQYDAVLRKLCEVDVGSLTPEAKTLIRDTRRGLISRHRQFSDADWAMPDEEVDGLQRTYERFEPSDPVSKHAWLFTHHPDLPEPSGEGWQAERENVEVARAGAAREVYDAGGLKLLLELAANAEQPGELGRTLGTSRMLTDEDEAVLFEGLGSPENPRRYLARGLVVGCFRERGWEWVEGVLRSAFDWSPEQKADLFFCLPLEGRTWDRLEATGDEAARRLYWTQTGPYGLTNNADCARAVEEFIAYGRPHAAVDLICGRSGRGEVERRND